MICRDIIRATIAINGCIREQGIFGRLPQVKTSYNRAALERQIDATERQIDRIACELYGISDEEIRLVEDVANA